MLQHFFRVAHSVVREKLKSALRSPHWRTIEKRWLEANPKCAACGGTLRVQVHHRQPFHLHPELELADGTARPPASGVTGPNGALLCNLISVCMGPAECHLRIAHGGNFSAYNPNVAEDAREALAFPARRPLIEARAKKARKLA